MNVDTMTPSERLALWDTHDRPERWNSGNEHHLADLIIRDLRGLSTPPADDVLEALQAALFYDDNGKTVFRYSDPRVTTDDDAFIAGLIPAILAATAEVRPHGTVTDAADVDSNLRAALAGYLDLRTVARVMADLEAAREVHP